MPTSAQDTKQELRQIKVALPITLYEYIYQEAVQKGLSLSAFIRMTLSEMKNEDESE